MIIFNCTAYGIFKKLKKMKEIGEKKINLSSTNNLPLKMEEEWIWKRDNVGVLGAVNEGETMVRIF